MEHYDILIVGGGAAGISAAKAAKGARVLLAEREKALGGVLLQCVHRGFGRDMDGAEYAAALLEDFPENVELALSTTVLKISENKKALLSSRERGRCEIGFERLILATGCRELAAGALNISGTRPNGVYTAGQMQRLMNLYAHVPKGPALIIGSGDIGLIMACQLAEKGIDVTLVERENSCGGMARNRRNLEKYPIRLILNTGVSHIYGYPELEGVKLTNGERLDCATLLVAAGLVPERQLIHGLTEPDWLGLCGNCKRVHPMIEGVVEEGIQAGKTALECLR